MDLPPFPAPEPEIVEMPEMVFAPMDVGPMDVAPLDVAPVAASPRAVDFPFAPSPASGSLEALQYFAYTGFDYISVDMPPNLVSVSVRCPLHAHPPRGGRWCTAAQPCPRRKSAEAVG